MALDEVSIQVQRGTVHAIVGENGAGKSTLVGHLFGHLQPSAGSIVVNGEESHIGSPREAKRLGIGMVHQHFMLAPQLTVSENLMLERVRPSPYPINSKEVAHAFKITADLGWTLDPHQRVEELSVGQRQRLELLKALQHDPSILILDEPTAVLTPSEVTELFQMLQKLKAKGCTIILIAHKLSEIMQIADHITVLRFGKVTLSVAANEASAEKVAEAMVGEAITLSTTSTQNSNVVIAKATDITIGTAVQNLNLSVHKGDILGIGGVDGNGQVELAEVLAGVRRPDGGTLVGFKNAGYIPSDRLHDGLVSEFTIEQNLLLGSLNDPNLFKKGWVQAAAAHSQTEELRQRFDVRSSSVSQSCRSLSGGNQQKVVVARELSRKPQLIIAVYPTRGLDFKASQFILHQLTALAARGGAVVLFSTDSEELASVCTRTRFMSRGKLWASWSEALTS